MNWMLHYNAINTIAWFAYPNMEPGLGAWFIAERLKQQLEK